MAPPPPEALALECAGPSRTVRASLGGAFGSIAVPHAASFWRKLWAFVGPGYLVAVGYMDPANWATDIAGGSRFGYQLLFVIFLSNIMAMVLQSLAAKLGIVSGRDLAQACAERYRPSVRMTLWLLCEAAIIACDFAEVVGTAVALQLLFGVPLVWGVCLTACNMFIIIALERRGFRKLEAAIVGLMLVTGACLGVELLMSRPDLSAVAAGLVPTARAVTDRDMLYLAIGIIGATVMPHNLYLHSAIVQSRRFPRDAAGKREAIRFATIDSVVALGLALLTNASILILAASSFHARGRSDVVEIGEAYRLLSPMLGAGAASMLFGVALLASSQNSTVTGTLAGQVVMEGFTSVRVSASVRRVISRLLAIVPAAIAAGRYGEDGIARLLIASQVVLSLQLPFAMVPLVLLTGDPRIMREFTNRSWMQWLAWSIVAVLIALNVVLLGQML